MWVSRRYNNMNYALDVPSKFMDYANHGYYDENGKYHTNGNDLVAQLYARCDENTVIGLKDLGVGLNNNTPSSLWRYSKYRCDYFDIVSKEFDQYVKDNPWVKDFYEYCVKEGFHYSDAVDDLNLRYHWTAVTTDETKAPFLANFNFKNFSQAVDRRRLAVYNEMLRPVPFAVGNLVMLKKPYIMKQSHDPFYWNKDLKNEERVGIITEVLNDTHRNSFNGPGSRLVTVLWSASGEKSNHSIKTLKLLNRKDKIVNKLKERDYDIENPSPET